jgi:hypothetical protein
VVILFEVSERSGSLNLQSYSLPLIVIWNVVPDSDVEREKLPSIFGALSLLVTIVTLPLLFWS